MSSGEKLSEVASRSKISFAYFGKGNLFGRYEYLKVLYNGKLVDSFKEALYSYKNHINEVKTLLQVDTSIMDFSNNGLYVEGNFKHSYFGLFKDTLNNSLKSNNLLGGVKLGINVPIGNNFNVGPFLEYDYDALHTAGTGIKFKLDIDKSSVLGMLRYRINIKEFRDYPSTGHNADVYLRYNYNYTKNNFFIQGQLSGLFSYGSEFRLTNDTFALRNSISPRYIFRMDLGFKVGGQFSDTTTIYLEPKITGQYIIYNRDYFHSYAAIDRKVDKSHYTLNFGAKLGMDHKLGNLNLKESVSLDYLGNLKANVGFEYIF